MKTEHITATSPINDTTLRSTRNSLAEKRRVQIVGIIQKRLSDSVDLTLQFKHAHWNIKSLNFIAMHELFDRIAEETENYSDLIAERIAQLGGISEGTLQSTAERSSLPEYPLQNVSESEHIQSLSHVLAAYGELIRDNVELATELCDPATADILTEILRSSDKNLWFIESHQSSKVTLN